MSIRRRLDTSTQTSGLGEVDLDVPAQQSVARILAVWADGVKLQPTASENAPGAETSGQPVTYFTRRSDSELQLVLHPTPNKACSVSVGVALRPLYSATALENDLFELWLPAIISGAKASLMAIPDQSFSNPLMAQMQATDAARYTSKARVDGAYGQSRGAFRAQMRPFA